MARVTERLVGGPASRTPSKSGSGGRPQTLRNVTSAWIKEQRVEVGDGATTGYQVNMLVTFILDD